MVDVDPVEAGPADVYGLVGGCGRIGEEPWKSGRLQRGFTLALLMIYALLAIPLRSYLQPVVIMSAIPFGLVGAVWGHVLMGLDLTILSMFGAVALSGVVVNDSLVMVDFINRARASGMPLLEAVRQSGARRLRPILLTTLTTVMALMPMALGLAGDSKNYGPFAAAITFGLMVAMVGTLFIVPLAYTSLIVLQERWHRRPDRQPRRHR